MDVRIGVKNSPKELDVEMADDIDRDQLKAEIERVLANDEAVLWLNDKRGRTVGIPAGKIAYVEIGAAGDDRRIGFGA